MSFHLYGEASALKNLENLSKDYIDNLRQSLTDYEFRISIRNEYPTRKEDGFYPDRSEKHLYDNDYDVDPTRPLDIVLDYRASLSSLASFQINDLVVPGVKTLNFVTTR